METQHLSKNLGIYKIECKINGKFYIGSAKCIKYRINRHIRDIDLKKHPNKHLQSSFDLYGKENFFVTILEEYPKGKIDLKSLLKREQYYLDLLKPWDRKIGYNSCKKVENPNTGKWTEERRKKMEVHFKNRKCSEETKIKISKANKGKVNSPEAIEKMRKTKTGVKQSEENIAKRAKKYSFIGPDGQVFEGSNLKRFAEKHGLHRFNLNKVLSGERKSHHGFKKMYNN